MSDNPDEIFDLVDSDDRVIGTARRADVHANGWLHRAVHILVRRRNGEIFLQKRSLSKDCHPGTWDSSASGHLDSGEYYLEAAVRELFEELGITARADALTELGYLPTSDMTGQEFVRIYAFHHNGPFILHPDEIEEGKWISAAELDDWLNRRPGNFAPCFQLVWEASRGHFTSWDGPGIPG